ncbi:tetratricopeptide repeat protein [Bradyrhizobium sp. CCBAU 51627]|uniref:tetratricopeptide repeat protein n=1 Tax=Bradyrhizobium sp. CCBAU 51627 TaxID=1325088 RepID=UPI00230696DF|nr:tetratricopeptide repeat protein [Bradyrhizobium sp. CCBAU 51627]
MDLVAMFDDCAAALELGLREARAGNPKMIDVFDAILTQLETRDDADAREMRAAAHFAAATCHAACGQSGAMGKRAAKAMAVLKSLTEPSRTLASVDVIADALMDRNEHRRALPYCQQAVALTRRHPEAVAGRLWRAGRCLVRLGFSAEAAVVLREAIDLIRGSGPDLLLAHALLDLGNAILRSQPDDASPAFREAADIFAANDHSNQAATAWLNLGVLASRANRLEEALAWYEKVREARERDPKTTTTQRGNLHNNIANVYRRQRDFARARAEADRAVEILTPVGGEFLAHALGTQGEIRRDAGEKEAALEWFGRARAVMEALPNVNREKLAEKLSNEAEVLEALDRAAEAAALRARAAALLETKAPPTPRAAPKPAKQPVKRKSNGTVLVTLDGIGLPAEVYAQCDLHTLEVRLERRLDETDAGELDGHEHGPENVQLFLYGPNARALFDAIRPVLTDYALCRGAAIELRQGRKVERFPLSAA